MARHRHPLLSQAKLDALVRYGPEISGLKALLRDARTERRTSIHQAHGTASLLRSAIDEATPNVAAIYNDAGLTQARAAHTLVSSDLSSLGAAADPFKAASATEQAGLTGLMAGAQADALTGLQQQKVAAREGEGQAVRDAQSTFHADVAKILQRSLDLSNEKGAFTASDLYKLRADKQAARQALQIARGRNRVSTANSERSAGIDPKTGRPIKNGPLDPNSPLNRQRSRSGRGSSGGGAKPQSAAGQGALNREVQSALNLLQTEIDPKKSHGRRASGQALINGLPATKAKDKNGLVQTLVDAIKPHDPLAVRIANDMYYDGHISYATIKILRANGYRVKAIPGGVVWSKARSRAQARQKASRQHPHTGNWLHDLQKILQG